MMKHRLDHHTDGRSGYLDNQCIRCLELFDSVEHAQQHAEKCVFSKPEEKKLRCAICLLQVCCFQFTSSAFNLWNKEEWGGHYIWLTWFYNT